MESACLLERGPSCMHASIFQRPHKPSGAGHHTPCNNGFNSSSVLSVKGGNLSSLVNHVQKHLVSCTDASLGRTAQTIMLKECFSEAEGYRGGALAVSPSSRVHFIRKVSPVGRCSCKHCHSFRNFSSSSVFCFALDLECCSLLDTVSRRSLSLEKKQILPVAILSMVLRYRGQLKALVAPGCGKNQIGKTLCAIHEFPAPGRRKRMQRGGSRLVCEASGQEDKGKTEPDEENSEGASEQNPAPAPKKEGVTPGASPPESEPPESDWRTFRARLVVSEQQASERSETETLEGKEADHNDLAGPLPKRWAHPILAPETGCVLIATDKIDGQQSFERSVILLLSPGSTNPREGPYGLILNRPLSCRIKDIKPKDRTLVKFFGNCQVHHGGPLDENMFLLLHGTEGVRGYRQVIPGVYYGAASGLEEIMRGKRPLDYRFFFGYSGWSVDQLRKEIEQGLWCVAACSTDLITGHSAAGLWEEILLLMGGKYAELSKRPRRKHF